MSQQATDLSGAYANKRRHVLAGQKCPSNIFDTINAIVRIGFIETLLFLIKQL